LPELPRERPLGDAPLDGVPLAEPVREAALLPGAGEPPAALLLEDAGAPPLGFGGSARLLESATGDAKVEPWRLSCRDGALCAPATHRTAVQHRHAAPCGSPRVRAAHANTHINTASKSHARRALSA